MFEIDRAFERVILAPRTTPAQCSFEFISELNFCLGALLRNPAAKVPFGFPDEHDVISAHKCTKVLCDLGRRWISLGQGVDDDQNTGQDREVWFLESLWYLVFAIAREIPASNIGSSWGSTRNPYGPLKQFFQGFQAIPQMYGPDAIPERWSNFPYLKECAQKMFEDYNPAFLARNPTKIPETYSGYPEEGPDIDQLASQRKNLCSFLAHLTADGIFDFSEVLIRTLEHGLEIERTPEQVYLSKSELLLARQTMNIAGQAIWKHSIQETRLPRACGELWIHFYKGGSPARYCKQRWTWWRKRFLRFANKNDLGKFLPEITRTGLNFVAESMDKTRDDWTAPKPETRDVEKQILDRYNPLYESGLFVRLGSPEPVVPQDYGHRTPRRVPTDADMLGSTEIEEHRSEVFGPWHAKGNNMKQLQNGIPPTAVEVQASRKRKRPDPQKSLQDAAPVAFQKDPAITSQAPEPRREERPKLHYLPQKPGAPIPWQSNPFTTAPEEVGPSQSKRLKSDTAPSQPKVPRRAPKSQSIRKILEPRDSPIEEVKKSRLRHGFLQYQVKYIDIPLEKKEWYDSIGFKNDHHLAKIQDFHRKHPEADNEDTSAVWLAAKDAKQNAKALEKCEAKMAEKKAKGGVGYGFEENGLEESEHGGLAFGEYTHGEPMIKDAESAAPLLTVPQPKAADLLVLDPQLAALMAPPLPNAPAKPAEPTLSEIASLALFSLPEGAPDQAEHPLPEEISSDYFSLDYLQYPDPDSLT